MVFAGLKPDAPMAQKKSKIGALIESAEDLASRGLKPEDKPLPGPMTWTQRIGIVIGLLMIGGLLYVLVTVLQHPAEQAEKVGPRPAPVQIVPKGFKVDKNKDLEVIEINESLTTAPEKLNEDPHGGAWLVKLRLSVPDEISKLLTASDYQTYIGAES